MNRIKWLVLSLVTFMAAMMHLQDFTGWHPFGIAAVLTIPVVIYISLRYSHYLERKSRGALLSENNRRIR